MTRRDTAARKAALATDLRAMNRAASVTPGDMILSLRELSTKYELSLQTVSAELKKLTVEGVLYTIPRVGIFVGRPRTERGDLFVAIFRHLEQPNPQWTAIKRGFEERVSQLGGTSLILDHETARRYSLEGESLAPIGVFEFLDHECEPIWMDSKVARVKFGNLEAEPSNTDAVYFDNHDGGYQATRHLLAFGHRRIAFLGLHSRVANPAFLLWSKEREEGWRRALSEAGCSADGLLFQPTEPPSPAVAHLQAISLEVAQILLEKGDFSAVVACSSYAGHSLFKALQIAKRPLGSWPAIIGFDMEDTHSPNDALNMMSALRLPWEEIGVEAANLLWERSRGHFANPQQRLVTMSLISRISCRAEWHRVPEVMAKSEEQFAVSL